MRSASDGSLVTVTAAVYDAGVGGTSLVLCCVKAKEIRCPFRVGSQAPDSTLRVGGERPLECGAWVASQQRIVNSGRHAFRRAGECRSSSGGCSDAVCGGGRGGSGSGDGA